MADPFLAQHLIRPLMFDIGSDRSPASIRDQMIRGRLIVDRALEERLIGGGRRLLVIGAGAAGVTAAIRAAQRGVETWLVDSAAEPFLRQAGCTSRFVDPTQQDWPLPHWEEGAYPWMPPPMPLPWRRGHASELALHWRRALEAAQAIYPARLGVEYGVSLQMGDAVVDGLLPVGLRSSALGEISVPFGMALSCIGFGSERTTIGSYSGFRFWDSDPFDRADLGLPSTPQPRVLISGSGDGALEDCLRIFTRGTAIRSAADLYAAAMGEPRFRDEVQTLERRLQGAEDQAQRAQIWSGREEHEHLVLRALHQAHREAVAALSDELWSSICSAFSGLIVPARLELVHPCDHFAPGHALGHFLVLLVERYLREIHGRELLRAGLETLAVVPGPSAPLHGCEQSASGCHGRPHRVLTTRRACPNAQALASAELEHDEYDVVLIRHGVAAPTPVLADTDVPMPRWRLPLPYHVPG